MVFFDTAVFISFGKWLWVGDTDIIDIDVSTFLNTQSCAFLASLSHYRDFSCLLSFIAEFITNISLIKMMADISVGSTYFSEAFFPFKVELLFVVPSNESYRYYYLKFHVSTMIVQFYLSANSNIDSFKCCLLSNLNAHCTRFQWCWYVNNLHNSSNHISTLNFMVLTQFFLGACNRVYFEYRFVVWELNIWNEMNKGWRSN